MKAASAIYEGWVRHRRHRPREHSFTFPLFMMYLDLSEIERVFRARWLWSSSGPNVAWWRRADYLGDPREPLDAAVRREVGARTGREPAGPIRMLTHLRYLGHCFNPVTFYYCFDTAGERVESIVAQITNTPWKERHAYVLEAPSAGAESRTVRRRFSKEFHISPFMPMDIRYDWRLTEPGEALGVHMALDDGDGRVFDATLRLRRRSLTPAGLRRVLVRYPAMTVQVAASIHLHALRLWLKGLPVHRHPGARRAAAAGGAS